MAKDFQGLAVHSVRFVHGRPVFYASMPCNKITLNGYEATVAGDKHRLVSTLLDHITTMESPPWKRFQSFNKAVFPVQIACDRLGKPRLLLGEYRGPAISFSEGGGKVWAALCEDESDIGIDVAGTDEFQGEYPFFRVFHPQELQHALRLMGGDLGKASSLLWSIKEAVVKALGCGFHLVDPRQITVYQSVGGEGGYTFPVGLSGKAGEGLANGEPLWVCSLPQGKMWLSIALFNRQCQ